MGNITSWQWNFGNGSSSTQKNPEPFKYPFNSSEKTYVVTLKVTDETGCTDSASRNIVVVGNCNIAVPSAFTPNRDGRNDELFPTNAFNANNLIFRVYNRFGQIVFQTKDWQKKWDGNVNGQPQPSGTYVWTLDYVLKTTGRPYSFKGTTQLIR
jgi:gliding motility-associated-like protein